MGAIQGFHDELTKLRRDIHRHPELAFEERRTSALVADCLRSWGVDEVETGIAGTGVVGTIKGNAPGKRSVGFRADMDALPMDESNAFEHKSSVPGVAHMCGHDGHTVTLLGAARYLAETRNFCGNVHVIFQPAEEAGGGGGGVIEMRDVEIAQDQGGGVLPFALQVYRY